MNCFTSLTEAYFPDCHIKIIKTAKLNFLVGHMHLKKNFIFIFIYIYKLSTTPSPVSPKIIPFWDNGIMWKVDIHPESKCILHFVQVWSGSEELDANVCFILNRYVDWFNHPAKRVRHSRKGVPLRTCFKRVGYLPQYRGFNCPVCSVHKKGNWWEQALFPTNMHKRNSSSLTAVGLTWLTVTWHVNWSHEMSLNKPLCHPVWNELGTCIFRLCRYRLNDSLGRRLLL